MNELNTLLKTCLEGQGFGGNANPLYSSDHLAGHPGIDIDCGYGSPIAALASGLVYSLYTVAQPASDGYTAVYTLCHTPLEDFELSYGHVSEIDVQIGQTVATGDIVAKEGNKGPVYAGNRKVTLQEQAAGSQAGHHRHYQKRPVIKVPRLNGTALQSYSGTYRDAQGNYYQYAMPLNGYAGCVDWTLPLFTSNLAFGLMNNYQVLLLQRAMVLEGLATYNPTGYFGALNLIIVRAYQKQYGIPATGLVGPLTRAKLNAQYQPLG